MGAKGALGGGGLIALAAGAPPTWTVNASNTDNKSNNTSAKMSLLRWRHIPASSQATLLGCRPSRAHAPADHAPADRNDGARSSAVGYCGVRSSRLQTRDYADHMAWVRLLAYSYLLTYSLTYLLTYLLDSLLNVNDYLLDSLLDSLLTDCVDDITSFKSSDTSGVRVISIITTFHEIAWFFKKLFFKKKCNFHRIIDWKMIYFSIFCFSTDLFFDLFSYFFHWFREN